MNTGMNEAQARKEIIGRLNRIIETQSMDSNDEFIFGFSAKNKHDSIF